MYKRGVNLIFWTLHNHSRFLLYFKAIWWDITRLRGDVSMHSLYRVQLTSQELLSECQQTAMFFQKGCLISFSVACYVPGHWKDLHLDFWKVFINYSRLYFKPSCSTVKEINKAYNQILTFLTCKRKSSVSWQILVTFSSVCKLLTRCTFCYIVVSSNTGPV